MRPHVHARGQDPCLPCDRSPHDAARAYLCCEAKTLDDLAEGAAVASDKVLVSLLRDLGADRVLAQEEEERA